MPACLRQPYRLFFLGAATYAVIAMVLWSLHFMGVQTLSAGPAVYWHGYEMLFGFATAVIAGFILTAAESWTGHRTVSPAVLLLLFLAWCLARLGAVLNLSPIFILIGDGLVLFGVTVALGRVLWLSGNRRNLRFLPITALLGVIAMLMQLATLGYLPQWQGPLLQAGVDLVMILMVIMGGRVIPFFTQRRLPNVPVEDPDWLGFYAGFFVVLSVLLSWWPGGHVAAMFSWFAGCFLLARLFYWSPVKTWREPMLWILHVGYFWLAIALFLRGGAMAWGWMPMSDTLHAVTIGAMGCLTLGMMARVSLGHGGHEIRAPGWLSVAFLLIGISTIPRLISAVSDGRIPMHLWLLSSLLWMTAFLLFVVGFLPKLIKGDRQSEH